MIGIYKITNPKGKIYIGRAIDIERRWKKEYKSLRCKSQTKLYYSLKKYGPENHQFEVVEECLFEQLDEREIYWGLFFNVLDQKIGLNLRLGNGKGSVSKETRRKISKGNIGKKRTQETKDKMREINTGRRWKFSDEQVKIIRKKANKTIKENGGMNWGHKITKARKNKPIPKKWIKIIQFDKEMNQIKIWESIKSAEEYINNKKYKNKAPDNIGACCRGKQKSAYGFIWKYAEGYSSSSVSSLIKPE